MPQAKAAHPQDCFFLRTSVHYVGNVGGQDSDACLKEI